MLQQFVIVQQYISVGKSQFFPILQQRKSVLLCSFCSFMWSFLLSILSILLFFCTPLSTACSVFSLCLFTLFSDLSYCFLFQSVILPFSFLSSYNSILSASLLCSIQSVLYSICSLSVRALYLILLCYLFLLLLLFSLYSLFFTAIMTLPHRCFSCK